MRPHFLLVAGVLLADGAALFQTRFNLTLSVGESMEPTLASRELLLVDRLAYRQAEPRRGDIVGARHDGEWIVKRVVGLPGETVEVRDGRLMVNGRLFPEAHPALPGSLRIEPGTLQADRYALLGDNRSLGSSQTVHAVVGHDQIRGKVVGSLPLSVRAIAASDERGAKVKSLVLDGGGFCPRAGPS